MQLASGCADARARWAGTKQQAISQDRRGTLPLGSHLGRDYRMRGAVQAGSLRLAEIPLLLALP